jgi:hypothetical protein
MPDNEIAAWIMCEDLLVKVKTELANEAIITLQKEVQAGRMKVEGKLVSSIETQSDAERDLFVANEIAAESDKMLQSYSDYIKEKESKPENLTAEDVQKIEIAKKLMLAVGEISLLIRYRVVAEEWILEIEGIPTINDPTELLAHTIHGKEDERFNVLDFALKRKSLIEEEIFTDNEREMMSKALKMVENVNPS